MKKEDIIKRIEQEHLTDEEIWNLIDDVDMRLTDEELKELETDKTVSYLTHEESNTCPPEDENPESDYDFSNVIEYNNRLKKELLERNGGKLPIPDTLEDYDTFS